MSRHFMTMALEVALILTIATLLVALVRRRTMIAGRPVDKQSSPVRYWAVIAFDLFAAALVIVFLRDWGGGFWP